MDFDAQRQSRPRPKFTLCGREWTLPPSPTVAFMLEASRLEDEHGAGHTLDPEQLIRVLTAMMGAREPVDHWLAGGLDLEALEALLGWAVGPDGWGLTDGKDDDADRPTEAAAGWPPPHAVTGR